MSTNFDKFQPTSQEALREVFDIVARMGGPRTRCRSVRLRPGGCGTCYIAAFGKKHEPEVQRVTFGRTFCTLDAVHLYLVGVRAWGFFRLMTKELVVKRGRQGAR